MPKIVGPPPIANLDGIIDLLTNPEKYATYLQDLKQLHDSIKNQCEIYDTKEQAQAFLRQASNTLSDTQDQVQRLAKEQASAKEKFQADQTDAMQALATRTTALDAREQELRESAQSLSSKERLLLDWENALGDRVKKLDMRDEQLKAKSLDLARQEERIKKANETLTSLGM